MAYSTQNPPVRLNHGGFTSFGAPEAGSGVGAYGGLSLWLYKSLDVIATVQGAGYITDGIQRGMQVGDVVFVLDLTNLRMYLCMVISTTPAGTAANLAGTGAVNLNSTSSPLID
jgi:hypothetical protein